MKIIQGIYCIENIISGKKYYGSSMNISKRLNQHTSDLLKNTHCNIQLQRTFNKHGDIFNYYIVEKTNFSTRKELLTHEQTYIDKNINGYNMAPACGGDTISHHPNREEIIKKIKTATQTRIANMSLDERVSQFSRPGNTNPNWRDGGTSFKICPKCNISTISKTAKYCHNCRDRTKHNNPFFGKHHSEETKQLLREKMSGENSWIKAIDPAELPYTKKYKIIYPTGEIKIVAGLKIIAKEFDVSITNIYNIIKRCKNKNYPKRGKCAGHIILEMAV